MAEDYVKYKGDVYRLLKKRAIHHNGSVYFEAGSQVRVNGKQVRVSSKLTEEQPLAINAKEFKNVKR